MITTWPFLLCLALLLLNDSWLKSTYPGAITGKLSDFAGLAVVSLLLLAAWPRRAPYLFCCISLAFLWWKSPASEPFIQIFNELGLFSIGRTVDFTDMIALIIFPVCHVVAGQNNCIAIPWTQVRRYLTIPVAAITIVALLGTSSIPIQRSFVVRTISSAEELRREEVADVIKSVAAGHDLVVDKHPFTPDVTKFTGDRITMTYLFSDKYTVLFNIEARSNGMFCWNKSGSERVDTFQADLKKNLAERIQGLEYVEPLVPR